MGANPLANHLIDVELKVLDPSFDRSFLPEYQSAGAAAVDLVSNEPDFLLMPGETRLVKTGLAIHIGTPGVAAFILPRSGLGSRGLILGNGTGLIDSDYQGELGVVAWNRLPDKPDNQDQTFHIRRYDRIAQLLFLPIFIANMLEVDEFGETTDRGTGGFGSTGQ